MAGSAGWMISGANAGAASSVTGLAGIAGGPVTMGLEAVGLVAGTVTNLAKCGTITQIGCEKVAATKAQEAAQMQFALALVLAMAGQASEASAALSQAAQDLLAGNINANLLPGGKGLWGAYFSTSQMGFDQPNPLASIPSAIVPYVTKAKALIAGKAMTYAQFSALVVSMMGSTSGSGVFSSADAPATGASAAGSSKTGLIVGGVAVAGVAGVALL